MALLSGDGDERHVAVISQLHRAGCLEDIGQERVTPRERQDQINLVIRHELINRVEEIE